MERIGIKRDGCEMRASSSHLVAADPSKITAPLVWRLNTCGEMKMMK
jgi:hypothetical protein